MIPESGSVDLEHGLPVRSVAVGFGSPVSFCRYGAFTRIRGPFFVVPMIRIQTSCSLYLDTKVCKTMTFMADIMSLGLTLYIHLGLGSANPQYAVCFFLCFCFLTVTLTCLCRFYHPASDILRALCSYLEGQGDLIPSLSGIVRVTI